MIYRTKEKEKSVCFPIENLTETSIMDTISVMSAHNTDTLPPW